MPRLAAAGAVTELDSKLDDALCSPNREEGFALATRFGSVFPLER